MGGGLGGECEDVVLGKGASWKVLVPIARASITWIVHMPRRLRVGCRFARKRFRYGIRPVVALSEFLFRNYWNWACVLLLASVGVPVAGCSVVFFARFLLVFALFGIVVVCSSEKV